MELSLLELRHETTLSKSQPGNWWVLLGVLLLTPSNIAFIYWSSAKE